MSPNQMTRQTAVLLSCTSQGQLAAAERFLSLVPALTEGTLVSASIGCRARLPYVAVELTLKVALRGVRARQRLAFWSARAGGWARGLDLMAPDEADRFRATIASCELVLRDVTPSRWTESVRRVFSAAGCTAPPENLIAPELRLHLGGAGWNGFTFDPAPGLLHVPSPLSPPAGDVLAVALTPAGAPGETCTTRATVVGVVRPDHATPSSPAGFTLALDDAAGDAATILSARCARPPSDPSGTRAAPRHAVLCGARLAPRGEAPQTGEGFFRDQVTNLSHGGAFVRTANVLSVGTCVELHLRLPPCGELVVPATVVHRGPGGVGVRFDAAAEVDAKLGFALAWLAGRPPRVLVVDDDAFARKVLADAFGERGWDCVTAPDGDAGLRTLLEDVLALEAVVTDVVMPGLSGEALISRVREAGGERSLVVVAVTADRAPDLARRLACHGADATIGKEEGPAAVVAAVEAAFERHRAEERRESSRPGQRAIAG
jgi:CheY-like chemotaxis protein